MKPVIRTACIGALLLASSWIVGAQPQEGGAPAASALVPTAAVANADTLARVTSGIPAASGVDGWTPVDSATLDEARGGFDLGNGLVASFGIDRAVYVNGNLVTSTSFNVPDIAHMTVVQAQAMQSALNSVSLTQVGPNNSFDPSALGPNAGATVIQNTLNNQHIQSITTINTSVNSLNAFRDQNFQNALQQAQLQSLGH
ncbi:MAG TPA: hypothetical protein VFG49_00780 [Dyella sp.]|uniref:hypothetical protein n=1 Tax=Dyella sp. TaxID=1869338 RepID=UPI002D7686DC|nr:hypothetical protein [Dyella sp.]HET6552046.1 hypothetical protein [Dyella sp.]